MAASNGGGDLSRQQPQTQPQPAQQWVGMQYPAAAMVQQQQMMMYPHHYMAAAAAAAAAAYGHHHHHMGHYQQHPGYAQQPQLKQHKQEEIRTLWVGDLHHWMDESYLHACFAATGQVFSVKVIRNKQTGQSEGYGFVEFYSRAAAEKVLQTYNGTLMPNTEQTFRLNWATFSQGEKRLEAGSDLSIFVGDLAADVTDSTLLDTFSNRYPSVKAAKVVFDANTGRSKGYGFVRFGDDNERTQAMTEMNGVYCSSRPMRIGAATPRKSSGYQHGGYGSNGASTQGFQSDGDSSNTTIFVGGLDPSATDEDLRQPFSEYGEIVSVKIPSGKGCGFVQFANRNNAEEALQKLNGTVIGSQTVRLSWGRNPANKQFRGDFGNQWGGGAYYGGHVYDGYGYAVPPPNDPGMYAAAYGTYPVYGSHQQQVN